MYLVRTRPFGALFAIPLVLPALTHLLGTIDSVSCV